MLKQPRGRVLHPWSLRRARAAVAGSSLVLAGTTFWGAETLAARSWADPRYRRGDRYVSDLGVPVATTFAGRQIASPRHALMNAGFIAQGLLVTTAGIAVEESAAGERRTSLRLLAGSYGLAMVAVGVFHGADASSRMRHSLHGAGASVAVVTAAVGALLCGSTSHGQGALRVRHRISRGLGVTALGAGLAVPLAHGSPVVGLVQRSSLYAVAGWQVLSGGYLLDLARRRALVPRRAGPRRRG